MSQELAKEIIKKVPDLITPAAKRKTEYFRDLKCVSCGGSVMEELSERNLKNVLPGDILPYGNARCMVCRCLFEPTTRIVVERGSITNAIEPSYSMVIPGQQD